MEELYYIGLDVHKKSISYALKTQAGEGIAEGKVAATRAALNAWAAVIEHPWVGAAGNSGTAPRVALPSSAGRRSGAHEK